MTSEDGSNGLKMDFDGLTGCEKLEIFFNRSRIPFHSSLAKSLQLTWWYSFVDQLCLIFSESQKSAFLTFLFLEKF